MAYIEFANKGEIDINAFKLLGASSKREATDKIGFFGSGLKYATALMLREDISFQVFAGKKEVLFGLEKQKFSGIDFDVITINGEKTSMTTQAGPDWEPWFAIREIYSNTIDEGGAMEIVTDITPTKGETKIYIEMSDKLGDVTRNWQDYFSFKRPALDEITISGMGGVDRGYKIFAKRRIDYPVVFRRGIRVGEFKSRRSLFDYDFTEVEINESRVMRASWAVQGSIADALMFCDNVEVLKQFFAGWKDQDRLVEYDNTTWSYAMNDSFFGGLFDRKQPRFSDEWLNQLQDKRLVPTELSGFYGITHKTIALPNKLLQLLKEQFGDKLHIAGNSDKNAYRITGEPNDEYKQIANKLNRAGFAFPLDQIKMGKFHDDDIHGQYDPEENLIILTQASENWSSRQKTTLLLEELLHKKSGFGDKTRDFQNFLIEQLADKIEG